MEPETELVPKSPLLTIVLAVICLLVVLLLLLLLVIWWSVMLFVLARCDHVILMHR